MNSIKKTSLLIIIFIVGMLSVLTDARAQVDPPTTRTHTFVNPIILDFSSNQFTGKYLTVYYGYGSPGSLRNQDDQITLREVRERQTFRITGTSVRIPQMALKKVSINIAYSIVVFVVHDGIDFTWLNGDRTIDGGIPKGESVSNNNKIVAADYQSVIEIKELKEAQGIQNNDSSLKYLFGSRSY